MDFLSSGFVSDFMSRGSIFLFSFLLVIPALTMHEWAHAWMANRLGDSTARMLGRMTLNPLKHIDPIGTVLVPLILLIASAASGMWFIFGWAKPVPFNPRHLKDPKRDTALIGIAGPAINVIMAVATAIILTALRLFAPQFIFTFDVQNTSLVTGLTSFGFVLGFFCYINLILCFFNLLPIPPFDGSRIVQKYLKGNARHWYDQLERYGMFIVLGLIWIPPMLFGFSLIGMYFSVTAWPVFQFITGIPVGVLFSFIL